MNKILKSTLLFLGLMVILEMSSVLTSLLPPKVMLYFGQFIVILTPVIILALLMKLNMKERFKLHKFKPSTVLYCFVLFIALLPISGFIGSLTTYIFGQNANGIDAYIKGLEVSGLMQWFIIAVTPAICEEMMFRGLLLDKKMGLNIHFMAILSGLTFAMFHVGFDQLFYTFPLGMVFAYVTLITGSIFPAMLMHLFNNSLGSLVQLIPAGPEEAVAEEAISLMGLLPMFAVAVAAGFFVAFLLKKLSKSYKYDDKARLQENKEDLALYKGTSRLLTYLPLLVVMGYVLVINILM